jgi:DNA-binding NtrC family response regulator
MSRALRVLIVEDRPADAELIVRELRRAGFAPDWNRVDTEGEFSASLRSDPEVILCDYVMPEFSGLGALELLHQSKLEIPLIIVSGTIGEETAVAAMKEGATDYLLKDRLGRLGPAVSQALERAQLRKERKQAEEEIGNQLQELQRWHEATLGREDRVHELKREVNDLLAQQGQPARYSVPSSS